MHAFMETDVGKDRLDNAEPPGVDLPALLAIDLRFHLIDQVGRQVLDRNGQIAANGICLSQTARPERAGGAVLRAGMVEIIRTMTVEVVAGMARSTLFHADKGRPVWSRQKRSQKG